MKFQLFGYLRKHLAILLRVFFAILVAYILSKFQLHQFEFFFYDLRTISRPSPTPPPEIQIVMIDKQTVETFKTMPEAKHHSNVIQKLLQAKPAFVIYVSDLAKIPGSPMDLFQLGKQLEAAPDFYQAQNGLVRKDDESSKLVLPTPFEKVKAISFPKTADNKSFAQDGITRRAFVSYQDQPTYHPIIASYFNDEVRDLTRIRGQFDVYDARQVMIDYHKPNSFPVTKFEDLAASSSVPEEFAGKIVLVGDDLGISHDDYIYSPYLRAENSTTITEMHANMLSTFIRNSAPVKAPPWVNTFFTILISILTLHVVMTVKPLRGILILITAAASFTVLSYFAFWPFGVWIDMAHPFLAIFLCYYFFIPYRLIVENRKSWEYQQKHRLLSEVEQLKTNFIGMMSHDLKTPLARIQGMTDIITRDPTSLSSPQREALDTIKQSAEDLLKFISTILNYAKIESQGVELHLQAKDVNQLIKDVVKKHEFLAKVRHIQIISELEPLFSLQIDPELLKQVLSNLVENAIKYSPENSKVLITSEETNGNIVIQVADQGMGIPSDELSNIFMKFFRSKNAKASPIRGSGLGLYLAKYFVELHRGRIYCESTVGQGSTFTVELPLSR